MNAEMRALAEAIESEVARASVTLRRLSEADAVRSRGDGKWVKKQIVGQC